jgi:DNA-binding PadR family transcriptional regulator
MPKKSLDPLPSAAFQILLALVEGDLHGYGIMRAVQDQTLGEVRLGPGTLYSSLQSLLEAGAIEEVANDAVGAERRRYYRLSAAGRKLVRSEAKRLEDLLKVVRAKKVMEGKYA